MSKNLLSKPNLSKIIMGISMMGFFGIASPNTASANCAQYSDNEQACSDNHCRWQAALKRCQGPGNCWDRPQATCHEPCYFINFGSSCY